MDETLIWLFLFSMLGVLGIFIAIAANRKYKGYKLIILRDFRNFAKGPTKYWALYRVGKDSAVKMYANIFKPTKSEMTPPFDLGAFSYNRTIYAVRGVTGHPEDDNIVPIHIPLVGQGSAIAYSNEISSAVISALAHKQAVEAADISVGDIVDYRDSRWIVSSIGADGVELHGQIADGGGSGADIPKAFVADTSEYARFKPVSKCADRTPQALSAYLGPDWVFRYLGLVPVQDANIILRSAKDAIATFNSAIQERQQSVMSMFARYPWLIPMALLSFVVVISASIIWYSVSQDAGSVASTATAAIQHLVGLTATSTIPVAT